MLTAQRLTPRAYHEPTALCVERSAYAAFKVMVNVVPVPGWLSTSILP